MCACVRKPTDQPAICTIESCGATRYDTVIHSPLCTPNVHEYARRSCSNIFLSKNGASCASLALYLIPKNASSLCTQHARPPRGPTVVRHARQLLDTYLFNLHGAGPWQAIRKIERGSWSALLACCLVSCELEQTESVGIMSYNRDRICRHCHWYRRIIHAKIRILNLVLFPLFHHKRTLVIPMQ